MDKVDNRPTTSRFHPVRWERVVGGMQKICDVCGKHIGEVIQRQMLNEIVLYADPEGCCEVRLEPK